MTKAYIEFTDLFSRLSPYELNHLSEVFLCKLESEFEGQLAARNKNSVTEKDIKYALTEAMRDISVALQERELAHNHANLKRTKALMFSASHAAV